MNRWTGIGRLTKDPTIMVSQSEKQTTIARYTLACDKKYKDAQNTADFINCVALGKNGEFAEKYLHKGMKIAVVGHIQSGSYKNKDGNMVYNTEVLIDEHEFVESKSANVGNNSYPSMPNPDGFMNVPDMADDAGLPFQ